jgi:hypothetical protein
VVIKSPDWISLDLENLIEFLDYSDMVITDEYTLLKVPTAQRRTALGVQKGKRWPQSVEG